MLEGDVTVANVKRSAADGVGGNLSAVNFLVHNTAEITGLISASASAEDGTSSVSLGGEGDATASSGRYFAEAGGTIAFQDSGSWVINE